MSVHRDRPDVSERLERESSNELEKRHEVNLRFLCLLVLTHV